MIRAHSGSATEPSALVGSPNRATRTIPSGWRAVGVETSPATIPEGLCPRGRSTGTSRPSWSSSSSVKVPSAPVSIGTIS